jgi:hypothetical protein
MLKLKHAIDVLEAEDDRLCAELTAATRHGKPQTVRPSEWAMTLGSMKHKRMQVFEAIQVLKKVGSE